MREFNPLGPAKELFFFIWKADEKLYKKIGLYEGGQFLEYKLDVVRNCFNGVFRSSAGQMGS